MSKYTTGEMAKMCDVSVRTVQYYDSRNILTPSELSEGGRRLYSDDDLKRLKIICFLRDMGFSIDKIATLFADGTSHEVIALLIEQQEGLLAKDYDEIRAKLDKLNDVKRTLKVVESLSVDTFGDIAYIMKNQNKRKSLLWRMLVIGIVMDVIEISTFAYGIETGNWIPFAVGLPFVIALGVFISVYYFKHMAFICPKCHEVFRPRFRSAFFASHTPNTRRLRCPKCGVKSFCVETYRE